MNSNSIMNLVIALGAVFLLKKAMSSDIIEGFGTLPAFTWKVERVAEEGPDNFYTVPGNYQSSIAPRMSGGVNYGAYIRYNMPDKKYLAADPNDPLSLGNMVYEPKIVQENFEHSKQKEGCQPLGGVDVSNSLPVQPMGGMVVNDLGQEVQQPVIYDRLVFANQKSRLREGADPIRGDLPIAPVRNEWFRPNVHPNIDLNSGALAVIGGLDLDTSKQLLDLQNAASGGLLDVGSGINYSVQNSMYNTNAGADVQVTAFP